VATSEPSFDAPGPLRFAISGRIKLWDPVERRLWIDERPLWVVPGISVPDPVAGTTVTAVGHREKPNGLWVVTYITRHRTPSSPG
jgi:hypothetical protein